MTRFEKIYLTLARITTWLHLRAGIYRLWSKMYQAIWERQRVPLKKFESLTDLVTYIRTLKWRPDTWRQLWDTFSNPYHIQYIANTDPKRAIGDCLPADTKLLKSDLTFVNISDVKIGDELCDGTGVAMVLNVWDKGVKEILDFKLNNGAVFSCTPDHKVFVVPKIRLCAGDKNKAVEVRAGDVEVGDDLLTPENIPEGTVSYSPELAWALGVFVADGWVDGNRACISGKDGHPKEQQKMQIQSIFKDTSWHPRYIRVYDESFLKLAKECGKGALLKKFPTVNVTKETAVNLLKGLEADANIRNGIIVYGTVSFTLTQQIRLLCRIVGKSCSIAKVDNHGGLGKNPIYRITVRNSLATKKFARVRSVAVSPATQVFDIETSTNRFYLPESDIVVHNCDEFSAYETEVLSTQNIGLAKPWEIANAEILTIMWLNPAPVEEGETISAGHNVCLLTHLDGSYSYMDYGYPGKRHGTISQVVADVLSTYAPKGVLISWGRSDRNLKCKEFGTA